MYIFIVKSEFYSFLQVTYISCKQGFISVWSQYVWMSEIYREFMLGYHDGCGHLFYDQINGWKNVSSDLDNTTQLPNLHNFTHVITNNLYAIE